MAINITCFCKLQPEELQTRIETIRKEAPDIFPRQFVLYDADELSRFSEEIAADFKFYTVKSECLIVMAEKFNRDTSPKDIANIMRKYVGEENILVLLLQNDERL